MIQKIFTYAKTTYQAEPEYLFSKSPDTAVLRNPQNQKWFAAIMRITRDKLGLKEKDFVWIIDLKCDPIFLGSLLEMDGYFPAYHMNKQHWISILLDGTVDENQIFELIDLSYHLTESKKIKK